MQRSTAICSRDDALAYLYGRIDYERTTGVPYRSRDFKLDRMWRLMARLGNPQDEFRAVHVAGTKGKGSTATMLAGALTASGRRTGLYTSPHLERLEERLVVDGALCSEQELIELVRRVQPAVTEFDHESAGDPGATGLTYFEITTAMALLHFARCNVNLAVLEVGLGGRLDSTNVCRPVACVITTISFDHMRQLGNTLAAIAGEKAGILKPGVPVISGVMQPEPRDVIEAKARELDCPLHRLGVEFDFVYHRPQRDPTGGDEPDSGSIDYRRLDDERASMENVPVGLIGRHQAANAALALAAFDVLRQQGWDVPEAAVRRGLAGASCPARVEVVSRRPTIVIDAAHNAASVAALVNVLKESFGDPSSATRESAAGRRTLVFATSLDKDLDGMLRLLLPNFDRVIFTRYLNNPRAVDPGELLSAAQRIAAELNGRSERLNEPRFEICADPSAAAAAVRDRLDPHDLLCVTGSFFIAAEMRALLCWA